LQHFFLLHTIINNIQPIDNPAQAAARRLQAQRCAQARTITMDPNQFSQLLNALRELTVAQQAAINPPANNDPAPPAPNQLVPYDGGALDLTTKVGQSLYFEGKQPLPSKFNGKIETFYPFLTELSHRARSCCWDSPEHGILSIPCGDTHVNLLEDFGRLTAEDVEAARIACDNGNDVFSQQNARMMYESLWTSFTEDAKDKLVSEGPQLADGPTLFFKVANETATATFSSAQATRDQIWNLCPSRFKYNIPAINNFLKLATKKLLAAQQQVSEQEISYFQFKTYKKIRSPAEWTTRILFLENQMASTPGYNTSRLYTDVEEHYKKLVSDGLWKPSDKSPEEQALSMMSSTKRKGGSTKTNTNSDSRLPPFAKSKGKKGDTKDWNGVKYYWCPAKHRNTHWHKHKPNDCNVYKKWLRENDRSGNNNNGNNNNRRHTNNNSNSQQTRSNNSSTSDDNNSGDQPISVNRDALRRGMAAILGNNLNIDPSDAADGLLASLLQG
jgi:hypothetical protein